MTTILIIIFWLTLMAVCLTMGFIFGVQVGSQMASKTFNGRLDRAEDDLNDIERRTTNIEAALSARWRAHKQQGGA